jgi:hypothetical protein
LRRRIAAGWSHARAITTPDRELAESQQGPNPDDARDERIEREYLNKTKGWD